MRAAFLFGVPLGLFKHRAAYFELLFYGFIDSNGKVFSEHQFLGTNPTQWFTLCWVKSKSLLAAFFEQIPNILEHVVYFVQNSV